MKFINLTPHDINIVTDNGIVTIPRSGTVARCTTFTQLHSVVDGIKLFAARFGDVVDLPSPTSGVFYIVSMLVKQQEYNRLDLLSPGELVRDDKGTVVGCKGLSI